ncbi:MAG: (Fe-S)-binding protein [Tannerella sp.]|jgi:Fe-S oxidoreductase|nr:(Fe-S)-binding protein [Tannerella sp.]
MPSFYHPFVVPFVIGTIALFSITAIKFYRWITKLDKKQQKVIRKTFFTMKVFPALWKMLKELFNDVLLHVKVSRHGRLLGYMHRSIALGWFLLIIVGTLGVASYLDWLYLNAAHHPFWLGVFFNYFIRDYHTPVGKAYADIMDLLLLYILSGILLAVIKSVHSRIVGMKKPTRLRLFDVTLRYSLWLIFPLRLIAESVTAAIAQNGGFVTQSLGGLINIDFAKAAELPLWTSYSIALGIFLMLFPFSRYMHIFTEPLLIVLRSLGVRESEVHTGYTRVELSACSRCGICIDGCPLDSELGIKNVQAVYLLRDVRNGVFHRKATENCLMCNKCETDCPVGIEISAIRRQERDKGKLNTEDNYPFIEPLKSFNAIGRVAYFGGCMSHLTPGITESMKKIFESVGQKYWTMDEDRTICCGRPLQQQGFHSQAAELRKKNTELLQESHAQFLVTSCPICYQSFKKEYDLPVKVLHHSEYIAMAIKNGKLRLNKSETRVAYHDPCELGRGSGIYDEPREVLEAVSLLVAVDKERKDSVCCGYNLGNTVLTLEQQMKVRDTARNNLTKNNPDIIATACPLCKKAFQHSSSGQVKDIAEIVAENIIV